MSKVKSQFKGQITVSLSGHYFIVTEDILMKWRTHTYMYVSQLCNVP